MAIEGVHSHRGLEVAELLAEFATRTDGVGLNHVVTHLEADTQGVFFPYLDEGEKVAATSDAPLGFIELIAVEVV